MSLLQVWKSDFCLFPKISRLFGIPHTLLRKSASSDCGRTSVEIGSGSSAMNLEQAERVGKIRKDELVFPPEAQGTRARINWLHPASRSLRCQGDSARFGLTTWQNFTRVRNHIALLGFGSKIWAKKQAKQRSPWQTGALSHEA